LRGAYIAEALDVASGTSDETPPPGGVIKGLGGHIKIAGDDSSIPVRIGSRFQLGIRERFLQESGVDSY
jgi:hypothetical protein